MIKRLNIGIAVVIAFVCSGCASTVTLAPEVASDLQNGNVAAAVYVEGKKIVYDEMVYKVLWNENRSQESVFEGSWDVDQDLTATFSSSLASIGLASQPADMILLDGASATSFEQSILNSRDSSGMNTVLSLSDDVKRAFQKEDIDHLILLRAAHYRVQKISGFSPQFALPTMLIVYDVRSGQQLYMEPFALGGKIAVEKSPREVEANGLAKLKAASHQWVDVATTTRLPNALGLHQSQVPVASTME